MIKQTLREAYPEIAKLLTNYEDGERSPHNGNKVWWTCPNCGSQSFKLISNIVSRGFSCPNCSDGISYPNKFMANVLKELNVEFIHEYTIRGKKYRYDFYIPKFNMIIEMHGRQHYEEWHKGNTTLQERIDNDCRKKEYAINSGIDVYIEIECKNAYGDYIKGKLLESELMNYFDLELLDWNFIKELSCNYNIKIASDLYKQGYKNIEISKIMNTNKSTTNKWLIQAHEFGWIKYEKEKGFLNEKTPVICITTGEKFDSIADAKRKYGLSPQGISTCCYRKRKYEGLYKNIPMVWRFQDDYDENEIVDIDDIINTHNGNPVYLIDLNTKHIINSFDKMVVAEKCCNLNKGYISRKINKDINNNDNTKWIRQSDYYKYIA